MPTKKAAIPKQIIKALSIAETFIEEELQVRRDSYLPTGSPYIDEAERALAVVTKAIAKAGGAL